LKEIPEWPVLRTDAIWYEAKSRDRLMGYPKGTVNIRRVSGRRRHRERHTVQPPKPCGQEAQKNTMKGPNTNSL